MRGIVVSGKSRNGGFSWEHSTDFFWEILYNVRPQLDSVQLVNITPKTMVYGIYNELVTGANLNQQTYLGGLTLYT